MRVLRVSSDGVFPVPSAAVADEATPARDEAEDALEEYPLVLVTWQDAFFDFDQSSPEDCRPDYLVRTVGFLVSDGPRFVSIAQEVLPDGDGFRAVTHIPVSIVESVTPLHMLPTGLPSPDLGPELTQERTHELAPGLGPDLG